MLTLLPLPAKLISMNTGQRLAVDELDQPFAQPLHQFLTYRMSRVQAKLNAQARRLLARVANISLMQWRIIALIGSSGHAHASELTRRAALDKGLFSRNLKILVRRGLVISVENLADHRVNILSLTPDGDALYQEILPMMRARQRALRAALDAAELKTLESALDKLEIASETDNLNL